MASETIATYMALRPGMIGQHMAFDFFVESYSACSNLVPVEQSVIFVSQKCVSRIFDLSQ